MKFKTTITHDDFKAFQKAAAQNSGIERSVKSFFKNMAIWFAIGLVGAVLVNLFKLKITEFNYPTAIITGVALLALINRNRNKMRPLPNGSIIGEHEYTLTDNEIIDDKGNHKSSSTYDSTLNVIETEKNIFIFIDKIAAYLINKQNIVSESSLDEITKNIQSKCNAKS